jgi:hypothetical protein
MAKKNVIGEKYHMLEIIDDAPSTREPSGKLVKRVIVRCDCGVKKEVSWKALKTGNTKSCGCYIKEWSESQKIPVNIGDKFNYWTLLEEVKGRDKRSYLCECVCGTQSIRPLYNLRKNKTKSCGCVKERKKQAKKDKTHLPIKPINLEKINSDNSTYWTVIEEISAKRNEKGEIKRTVIAECKCGYKKESLLEYIKDSKQCRSCSAEEIVFNNPKDETKRRLKGVYDNMKSRCNNPTCKSYPYYGGRNIKIEESFDTFSKFYNWSIENGYEADKGLEIDRKDGKGNYSVENCRWVTKEENQLNQCNINLTLEDVAWIRSENFSLEEALIRFTCSKYVIENIREYKTFKNL